MPEGLLLALLLGAPVGIVMVGEPVGIAGLGETDEEGDGDADGDPEGVLPAVAKVVMSVQSMGLKFRVGMPLARIWFMPPWCRLRYQLPGAGTLVTPLTTRVWSMMSPLASAVKSASMYLTGPWFWQLPRWMCAACGPGVSPAAVTEIVRVCADAL